MRSSVWSLGLADGTSGHLDQPGRKVVARAGVQYAGSSYDLQVRLYSGLASFPSLLPVKGGLGTSLSVMLGSSLGHIGMCTVLCIASHRNFLLRERADEGGASLSMNQTRNEHKTDLAHLEEPFPPSAPTPRISNAFLSWPRSLALPTRGLCCAR